MAPRSLAEAADRVLDIGAPLVGLAVSDSRAMTRRSLSIWHADSQRGSGRTPCSHGVYSGNSGVPMTQKAGRLVRVFIAIHNPDSNILEASLYDGE